MVDDRHVPAGTLPDGMVSVGNAARTREDRTVGLAAHIMVTEETVRGVPGRPAELREFVCNQRLTPMREYIAATDSFSVATRNYGTSRSLASTESTMASPVVAVMSLIMW